jgi:hypothetical protein
MAKVLFIPVSITAGLLAGLVGRKVFDGVWGVIDDEEPPDSKHRDISWGRLILAGAIQGAIFRAVKEATITRRDAASTAPPERGRASSAPIRSNHPAFRYERPPNRA